MARTGTQGKRGSRRQSKSILERTNLSEVKQNITGYDYRGLANKLRGNTILFNTGVGVGAFFLVKYAIRYYKGHPQIADFIKDNLDTVETKFREYRSQATGSENNETEARH